MAHNRTSGLKSKDNQLVDFIENPVMSDRVVGELEGLATGSGWQRPRPVRAVLCFGAKKFSLDGLECSPPRSWRSGVDNCEYRIIQ